MVRLFIKDNTDGSVHEYGTNRHDALILQDDGSLHYENMQCMCGTKFPEEGYSFCLEDGTIPEWDLRYGVEPYIDIGGVDAVPVVHGKWGQPNRFKDGVGLWRCDQCGEASIRRFRYCPECGAKMDGDDNVG